MRRIFLVFVLLYLALCVPSVAWAHGAGIAAILNTDPRTLTPGQPAKLAVALFDAYNSPIPGARIRIRIEHDDNTQQAPVALHESVPGTYTGEITLVGDDFTVLRVDATLPDGLWSGPFPVEPGPNGTSVWDMGIQLLHQDPPPAPNPPRRPLMATSVGVAITAVGLISCAATAIIYVKRRSRGH